MGRGRGREVVMRGIDERVMVTMINVEVMVMMEGGKKEGVMETDTRMRETVRRRNIVVGNNQNGLKRRKMGSRLPLIMMNKRKGKQMRIQIKL